MSATSYELRAHQRLAARDPCSNLPPRSSRIEINGHGTHGPPRHRHLWFCLERVGRFSLMVYRATGRGGWKQRKRGVCGGRVFRGFRGDLEWSGRARILRRSLAPQSLEESWLSRRAFVPRICGTKPLFAPPGCSRPPGPQRGFTTGQTDDRLISDARIRCIGQRNHAR